MRRQAETSDLLKTLGDSLIAVSQQATAAQQQTALQFSSLGASIAAQKTEAERRDDQRDSLLASIVHKMGELETRSGHPAASSSIPPPAGAGICMAGATDSRAASSGGAGAAMLTP